MDTALVALALVALFSVGGAQVRLDGEPRCNGRYCNFGDTPGVPAPEGPVAPGNPDAKIAACPRLESVTTTFVGQHPEDYTIYYTNAGEEMALGEEAIVQCSSPMAEMDFHGVPLQILVKCDGVNVTNGGWDIPVGECIRTSGCPSVLDMVLISEAGPEPQFTYQEYRHEYPGEPARPSNWFRRYENLTYAAVTCPPGHQLALNPGLNDFHCCGNGEIRLQYSLSKCQDREGFWTTRVPQSQGAPANFELTVAEIACLPEKCQAESPFEVIETETCESKLPVCTKKLYDDVLDPYYCPQAKPLTPQEKRSQHSNKAPGWTHKVDK